MGQSLFGLHLEPKLSLPSFKKSSRFISLINRFVCYNQGRYIEFEYLLGLKHKKIKDELKKESVEADKVRKYTEELLDFISNELKVVSSCNFEYIIEYFGITKKSKWQPRVCVKLIHNEKIADGFRNKRGAYYLNEHPVETNTGFASVARDGIWYLENDIPTAAKNGHYKNPRLDDNRVRNYSKPLANKLKNDIIDRNWMACWVNNDDGSPANVESSYKSTMIIPMTLRGNQLSNEFITSFYNHKFSRDRTIWGFLCADHPATNYFSDEIDRRIGYVFADIMSLYFISAFIHTENSSNFMKSLDISRIEGNEWRQLK